MTFLVKLKNQDSMTARKAFAEEFRSLPKGLKRTLTYDQGREMAQHKLSSKETEITVYFAHPHSPWERGSNENTNSLIRQYFPRGTNFNKISVNRLKEVQDELNDRPRKTLGFYTPHEKFREVLHWQFESTVKERLLEHLQTHVGKWLQIIDSMPIEVCKFVRAKYTKLFKGSASYGKWFGQTFFGYRLHLKITHIGMISSFVLVPANVHDTKCVDDLIGDNTQGWILADKGYRGEPLRQRLWQNKRIYLHTSLRRNDTKTSPLPKTTIHRLTGIRRLIETVAGQLEQQFAIKTTLARDLWHFSNRIIRKIVSHTCGVWINLKLNRDPLKLKSLVC
jgi:IS5 family transposase